MKAGKADGPADVDRSTEHKGSSLGTPGLTALDEEREASLADEGGASAAAIESQDLDTSRRLASDLPLDYVPATRWRRPGFFFAAGVVAVGAISALAALRTRR